MPDILINPTDERRILDFRPLGIADTPALGRYKYNHAHDPLETHRHRRYIEICYLERGQQIFQVDQQAYHLHGGDLFVTFPGESHSTGIAPSGKGVLYWFFVRPPRPRLRFLNLPPAQGRQLGQHLLAMSPRLFRGNKNIKICLDAIFTISDQPSDTLERINLQNWLLRLVLNILDCHRQAHQQISPLIRHIMEFIDANLDQPLAISSLAQQASLSVSRFKARFKKEIGNPPAEYVLQKKVERAKQLLSHNRQSITTIAYRLGFSSSQYFATVFKRYTNQSPSQFKQDHDSINR